MIEPDLALADAGRREGRRRRWRSSHVLRALVPTLVLMALVAIGPYLWTPDPAQQSLTERLQGPSLSHPLGMDQLGRDLLSRVLHGAQLSIGLSLSLSAASALAGTLLGAVAAMMRGPVDLVINRITDTVIAMPFLLMAIAISSLAGGGIAGLVLALTLLSWTNFTRVARTEVLRINASEMVFAARALGASPVRVLFVHVLPNALPALLVLGGMHFAHMILTIASMSFLGVGVQPPTPEWGALLYDGSRFIQRAPHLLIGPGIAIIGSSLVISLAAERLRQALDPRAR